MRNILKNNTILIHILIIIFVALLEIFLITGKDSVYGNVGDWFIQSVSFYEYFRNLLYETGEIFPDLALHVGGGQNIYYFAYYGLFSPYLLLFYLFPFVKAGDFLMTTNILNMIISSVLLYFFLLQNKYKKNDALFGALLLLISTGMAFFGFKWVMFVQYIPFLILGLFGTKRFLDTNKSMLLIISVILIITTSYYFSIPSIIVLCLYALYYYMKNNPLSQFKAIFRVGLGYVLRIIISIIITAFLLLPVLYVVLNGRTTVVSNIDVSSFLFGINVRHLMYIPSGVGLSSIVWFSVVYNLLYLKKENKILVVLLLLIMGIPFLVLALNGFLYMRGKVFVPFIPLFIILILEMLNTIKNQENKKIYFALVSSVLLSIVILRFNGPLYVYVFYLDLLMTYILLILYKKRPEHLFLIIGFIMFVNLYYIDNKDEPLSKIKYKELYDLINVDVSKYINNSTDGLYRTEYNGPFLIMNYSDAKSLYKTTLYSSTYNTLYDDIFYDVFNNNFKNTNMLMMEGQKNLFFEKFMGVRYLLTNDDAPYGYKKLKEYDNVILYENSNVYSLGFSLPNLMSYQEYNKLSFIERLLAYQNNIIVAGDGSNSNVEMNYEKVDLNYVIKKQEKVNVDKQNGHYIVDSLYGGKFVLSLGEQIKNKTLVIRFNLNNDLTPSRGIIINGVKNALTYDKSEYYNNNKTFDYVISSNDIIDELEIEFYRGIYDISDIEMYVVDNSIFDNNNTIPLNVDFDKTKGDSIYGNIDVMKGGYFIFTIPYDKGFTAYVDDEEVEIEQVSGGFIGFKIDEGKHNIKLTFEAPYAKIGRIVSLIGIVMVIVLNIYERRRYSEKNS